MRTILFGAAVAALSPGLGATASFAQQTASPTGGHYEWQSQSGPRAPAPRRVWVSDATEKARCDCEMMKMSPHDCMKPMHDSGAASSAG